MGKQLQASIGFETMNQLSSIEAQSQTAIIGFVMEKKASIMFIFIIKGKQRWC